MRHWFTTGCLTAVGVLMLVAASGTGTTDPADVLRQLGVPDSIARQWTEPYVPLWALRQCAAVVQVADSAESAVAGLTSGGATDCPPLLEIPFTSGQISPRYDSVRGVTEVYVSNSETPDMSRYDIAPDMSYTVDTLPVDVPVWLSVDLDCDGNIDLVTQSYDALMIFSAPDWVFRKGFVWPGYVVQMTPESVNIDDDRFIEVFVTPSNLGGSSMAAIIKYDSISGSFELIANLATPNGGVGRPAIGDFDRDGRMEFILGNNDFGYELFEWTGSELVYIGMVGDSTGVNNFAAVACRPKPGGLLHALVGESSGGLFRYQLLEPTGDNTFIVSHVFEEWTGWSGVHPCWAADTDCDGFDEMIMTFYPYYRVWEWDEAAAAFTEGCAIDISIYGSSGLWYAVDLDRDGRDEWGTVSVSSSVSRAFRAFPDPDCENCDDTGHCVPPVLCYCKCSADPECDGETNVLDVVGAVDVAFRSGQPVGDPFPQCPVGRTDVDCSGFTNVLDVVHLVNVAFRGGDPATEFCNPCP